MKLTCNICGHGLSATTQATVIELMGVHLKIHPDQHRELGLSIQLFTVYSLLQYADIPEDQPELLQAYELTEDTLFKLLGFDAVADKPTEKASLS
jgi:hypothetical protein